LSISVLLYNICSITLLQSDSQNDLIMLWLYIDKRDRKALIHYLQFCILKLSQFEIWEPEEIKTGELLSLYLDFNLYKKLLRGFIRTQTAFNRYLTEECNNKPPWYVTLESRYIEFYHKCQQYKFWNAFKKIVTDKRRQSYIIIDIDIERFLKSDKEYKFIASAIWYKGNSFVFFAKDFTFLNLDEIIEIIEERKDDKVEAKVRVKIPILIPDKTIKEFSRFKRISILLIDFGQFISHLAYFLNYYPSLNIEEILSIINEFKVGSIEKLINNDVPLMLEKWSSEVKDYHLFAIPLSSRVIKSKGDLSSEKRQKLREAWFNLISPLIKS